MGSIILSTEEKEVRSFLIEFIRKKEPENPYIHYQELCNSCEIKLDMQNNPYDRLIIGGILGSISAYEYSNGRPLLSSVVVSKSFEQGDGFYKLCEELGLGKWKQLKNSRADFAMTRECYAFWQDNINYDKYKE